MISEWAVGSSLATAATCTRPGGFFFATRTSLEGTKAIPRVVSNNYLSLLFFKFFTCSKSHVDRCANPLLVTPLIPSRNRAVSHPLHGTLWHWLNREGERLVEYGWKPHRYFWALNQLSRASIYWYTREQQRARFHLMLDLSLSLYIYIYIYIHIHMYIYIYIYRCM